MKKFLILLLISAVPVFAAEPKRPKDLTPASAPEAGDIILIDGDDGARALDAAYYASAESVTDVADDLSDLAASISNVDNTADADKPVSEAQANADAAVLSAALDATAAAASSKADRRSVTALASNALVLGPSPFNVVEANWSSATSNRTFTFSSGHTTAGNGIALQMRFTDSTAITFPSAYRNGAGSTITTYTYPAGTYRIVFTVRADGTSVDLNDDYGTASDLPFTPAGAVAATNIQAAIAEVDSEKLAIASLGASVQAALANAIGTAGAPVLFNGAGGTPTSLILTNATGLPAAQVTAGALAAAMTATTQLVGDDDTSLATTNFANVAARGTLLGSHTTPNTAAGSITWTSAVYHVYTNTTSTYNLPAASGYSGRAVIFYITGTNAITIDPNGSEVIVRSGTAQSGGVTLTLTGAAGNYVCLICDGARWVTLGYSGTLAAGS